MASVAALFGYKGTVATVTLRKGGELALPAPAMASVRRGSNLTVLTDFGTQANAEVLAVALREANLAWIVGDFTFGASNVSRRYLLGGVPLTVSLRERSHWPQQRPRKHEGPTAGLLGKLGPRASDRRA